MRYNAETQYYIWSKDVDLKIRTHALDSLGSVGIVSNSCIRRSKPKTLVSNQPGFSCQKNHELCGLNNINLFPRVLEAESMKPECQHGQEMYNSILKLQITQLKLCQKRTDGSPKIKDKLPIKT